MALKKSQLYAFLWQSCDELRGGMDAGQYKDYVLFMLFIKYISDKYADYDGFEPPVIIPEGAGFKDMLRLRGRDDIGERINTRVIQPLIENNPRLGRSDFPDFNDPNKLGEGRALVDRLTNLINIFNSPALDFSRNRADHDDILGDAYEYLMRHFAQESGKSKGQFYTPSEVSRIMARVIGVDSRTVTAATTAHDPTCGSGSLLLKVAAEAGTRITLHVRPGSRRDKRAEILHEWHKRQLHDSVPGLIEKWEPRIGVKVAGYYLQRMKTKWGSCNPGAGNIRLNTELVKKPRDLLEYVVVHEMIHLLEPIHSDRFITLLSQHCPAWQEARLELNELPVAGFSV